MLPLVLPSGIIHGLLWWQGVAVNTKLKQAIADLRCKRILCVTRGEHILGQSQLWLEHLSTHVLFQGSFRSED